MCQILGDVFPGGGHFPLEVSTLIALSLQMRTPKLWDVQTQFQGPGGAGGQRQHFKPCESVPHPQFFPSTRPPLILPKGLEGSQHPQQCRAAPGRSASHGDPRQEQRPLGPEQNGCTSENFVFSRITD